MENREIATKPDPFQIMDRLDDALIIEELEGRLPGILTYHFNDGKQEVWGLSKAGVDECKTELAKKGEVLRELEAHWDDKEEEAFFHVKVGRYVISKEGQEILLDTALGFKRQPKYYSGGKLNPFWYEQGAIKACRNACMRLIPKTIQQAIIEYAKQKGKVKDIKKDNHSVSKQSPKKEQPPEETNPDYIPKEEAEGPRKVLLKQIKNKIIGIQNLGQAETMIPENLDTWKMVELINFLATQKKPIEPDDWHKKRDELLNKK